MNVLSLVSYESNFYLKQLEYLEKKSINIESVSATKASTREQSKVELLLEKVPFVESNEHSLPAYLLQSLNFYPKIAIRSFRDYDIVHANSGMTAPFALAQLNRPIVLSLWGSDLMGDRLRGKYPDLLKWMGKYYDSIIVQSEEMKDILPYGNVYVIPSGVDFSLFKPMNQEEAQTRVGWDTNKKHVFWPYPKHRTVKNWPKAAEVMEEVQDQSETDIEFNATTGIEYDEMPIYYNAADVLLLTSVREGSPNTVKEALACNTPVVSTDVGDVHLRVADVKGSRVCSSKRELIDGILKALKTETCNGREANRDVSWEVVTEDILDVYRNVA